MKAIEAEVREVRHRRVLVVDDDPIVLQSCKRILESEGHMVICVPDAEEACVKLERHPFDLMVVDIKMPERDGFYLLEKIRGRRFPGPLVEPPVLVMTGYPTHETLGRLQKSRVRHFIPKPFTPDELLTAIDILFEKG